DRGLRLAQSLGAFGQAALLDDDGQDFEVFGAEFHADKLYKLGRMRSILSACQSTFDPSEREESDRAKARAPGGAGPRGLPPPPMRPSFAPEPGQGGSSAQRKKRKDRGSWPIFRRMC